MLTLILLILVTLVIFFYRKWLVKEREGKDATLYGIAFWATVFMAFMTILVIINSLITVIDKADVHEKYAEAQEKVVSLQSEIQDLKDSYLEKDADTFIAEYNDLAKQLEEAENYIKENKYFVEKGLSYDRFLLYFGG